MDSAATDAAVTKRVKRENTDIATLYKEHNEKKSPLGLKDSLFKPKQISKAREAYY